MTEKSAVKRKSSAIETVWWGEQECSNGTCTNHAYFAIGDKLLCGTHSRSNTKRVELPKNPNAKQVATDAIAAREAIIEETALENRELGLTGKLTVCKYRSRKLPDYLPCARNVYPNYWMQHRKDGFGCASLSPMSLGPVKHNQPGVPDALNIENYHQFKKVFRRDIATLDASNVMNSIVDSSFFSTRDAAYRDPEPHRHKYADEHGFGLFSIHVTPSGVAKRYTYVQSRYFYCHHYELLAKQQPDFQKLRGWLDRGYNLQIVGHDGYPVTKPLMEHYIDPVVPFGHEMVLYTLLKIQDPAQYPWNIYYEQNKELYE